MAGCSVVTLLGETSQSLLRSPRVELFKSVVTAGQSFWNQCEGLERLAFGQFSL